MKTVSNKRWGGNTYPVWSVSWSNDGRCLLSGSHDRSIRLWEIEWDLA
ncbi:WD40 repeat domain-containing protein [Actinoplanes sp. NPDC026670]